MLIGCANYIFFKVTSWQTREALLLALDTHLRHMGACLAKSNKEEEPVRFVHRGDLFYAVVPGDVGGWELAQIKLAIVCFGFDPISLANVFSFSVF